MHLIVFYGRKLLVYLQSSIIISIIVEKMFYIKYVPIF